MKFVFYLLWLCLISVLQPTLIRSIELWGIAPNLFLCFVVMLGFFRGPKEGGICGVVFGLVYDLFVGRMIGLNAILYLYLGMVAGVLGDRYFGGGKRLVTCVGTIAGTMLAGLLYYLAYRVVYGQMGFVTAVFRITLLEALYNGVAVWLLSYPVRGTMKLMRIKQIS